MGNVGNVFWVCGVCDKPQVSENTEEFKKDSRVVKLDISQSGKKMKHDDVDTFEFANVCYDCRVKLSNAIYSIIEEINPEYTI